MKRLLAISRAIAWAIIRFLIIDPVSFVLVLLLSPPILIYIIVIEFRVEYAAMRSAKRKEFLNHFR